MTIASDDIDRFLATDQWYAARSGPRYRQLADHIAGRIRNGDLPSGSQLPPEREIAALADVSRVTVRKCMALLVAEGVVEQRQGAGSFVSPPVPQEPLDQSLSTLTSFTDYMEQRGLKSSSQMLRHGLFPPTPDEIVALGLSAGDKVARMTRLRTADGAPLAIETSAVPRDILPDPARVTQSLYAVLRETGQAPVHAVQRLRAVNVDEENAALLQLPVEKAVLVIERTGFLANRRPIEFTHGFYRSDIYNFVAELRLTAGD